MRTNAPRPRSRTRAGKTQKFSLPFLFSSAGGVGGADKKWKGNFWFCFAVSVSEKSNLILTFLFALFSTLTATEAHPYPRLVVALNSATSMTDYGKSKNMDCARHKQIYMCLTHPPIRAQIPAVFRKHYKTAGIAPLKLFFPHKKPFCAF